MGTPRNRGHCPPQSTCGPPSGRVGTRHCDVCCWSHLYQPSQAPPVLFAAAPPICPRASHPGVTRSRAPRAGHPRESFVLFAMYHTGHTTGPSICPALRSPHHPGPACGATVSTARPAFLPLLLSLFRGSPEILCTALGLLATAAATHIRPQWAVSVSASLGWRRRPALGRVSPPSGYLGLFPRIC